MGPGMDRHAGRSMRILREESNWKIVRLVGVVPSPSGSGWFWRRRSIREDFLHQNAFHEVDTYTSLPKQTGMLSSSSTTRQGLRAPGRE